MNILFFYRVYPNYGGVEVVTTVLANRFIKDGHGVIIASIEQPHIELACQLLPDVKLVKLDLSSTYKCNFLGADNKQ